jgi:hypothetical protein
MKIKGWEKISGITYKGCTIVNPMHNADETKYEATILDLNHPQKPKWELSILTPKHKWKYKDDLTFTIILSDDNRVSSRLAATKEMIQTLSAFRMLYEDLIDEILHLRLQTTLFSKVSKRINGGTSGLMNMVNNNGTTIDYNNMMAKLLESIKESNQTIDNIKSTLNKS